MTNSLTKGVSRGNNRIIFYPITSIGHDEVFVFGITGVEVNKKLSVLQGKRVFADA